MDFLLSVWDFIVHLDQHLALLVQNYGPWVYAILFAIVFCETGLVVAPFLPGDSLLFIAGALLGPRVFKDNNAKYLKREHLEKAHAFYEKWGGVAIILARFTPFLRTYVPFVAGMARMTYAKFALYNITGGVLWVAALCYIGFFFGNIPWIKANQGFIAIGVVVLSLIPGVRDAPRSRSARQQSAE